MQKKKNFRSSAIFRFTWRSTARMSGATRSCSSSVSYTHLNGHYLSIDLGIHNLMTCYDSGNGRSFILGRKYLSLERYFHKEISRVQLIWYAQQVENGIKYPRSSKHIQRLYRKKQNAVKDYLHKVTRWLAEYCKKERISCVIIGDIRNIRKGKDIGHKTNQKRCV